MLYFVSPPIKSGIVSDRQYFQECVKRMESSAPVDLDRVLVRDLQKPTRCLINKYILAVVEENLLINHLKQRMLILNDVVLDNAEVEDCTVMQVIRMELMNEYACMSRCLGKGDLLMISEIRLDYIIGARGCSTCPVKIVASPKFQTEFKIFFMPITEQRMEEVGGLEDKGNLNSNAKLSGYLLQYDLKVLPENLNCIIKPILSSIEKNNLGIKADESQDSLYDCSLRCEEDTDVAVNESSPPNETKELLETSNNSETTSINTVSNSVATASNCATSISKSRKRASKYRIDVIQKNIQLRMLKRLEKENIKEINDRRKQQFSVQKKVPAAITSIDTVNKSVDIASNSATSVAGSSTSSTVTTVMDAVSRAQLLSTVANSVTTSSSTIASADLMKLDTAIATTEPMSHTAMSVSNSINESENVASTSNESRTIMGIPMTQFADIMTYIAVIREKFESLKVNASKSKNTEPSLFLPCRPTNRKLTSIKNINPGCYVDIQGQVLGVYVNKAAASHGFMLVWDGTKPVKPTKIPRDGWDSKFDEICPPELKDYVIAIHVYDEHLRQLLELKMEQLIWVINIQAKLAGQYLLLEVHGGGGHFNRGIKHMQMGTIWSEQLEERIVPKKSALVLRSLVEQCSFETNIKRQLIKKSCNETNQSQLEDIDVDEALADCDYIAQILTQKLNSEKSEGERELTTRAVLPSVERTEDAAVVVHQSASENLGKDLTMVNTNKTKDNATSELQAMVNVNLVRNSPLVSLDDAEELEPKDEKNVSDESPHQELCVQKKDSNEDNLSQNSKSEYSLNIRVESICSLVDDVTNVDDMWTNLPNDAEHAHECEAPLTGINNSSCEEENISDSNCPSRLIERLPGDIELEKPLEDPERIQVERSDETEECLNNTESHNEANSNVKEMVNISGEGSLGLLKRNREENKKSASKKRYTYSATVSNNDDEIICKRTSTAETATEFQSLNKYGRGVKITCQLTLSRISDVVCGDGQFCSVKDLVDASTDKSYLFRGAIVDVYPRSENVMDAFKLSCKACKAKFPITSNKIVSCKALSSEGIRKKCDLVPTASFKLKLCDPFRSTLDVIVCDKNVETFFWGCNIRALLTPIKQKLLSMAIDKMCPYPTYLNCYSCVLHCKLRRMADDNGKQRFYVEDTMLKCICDFNNCGR